MEIKRKKREMMLGAPEHGVARRSTTGLNGPFARGRCLPFSPCACDLQVIADWLVDRYGEAQGTDDPMRLAGRYHDMVVTNLLYLALMGTQPSRAEIEQTIDESVRIFLRGIAVER